MALFEPHRHEPLVDIPWEEGQARSAIERIAADTHAAFTEEGLWPIHPIDRSPERAEVLKPLYYGAAGVIWTLHRLQRAGLAELRHDYLPAVRGLLEAHRADSLRLTGAPILGYPVGDAGILLLHWTLAPADALASELHAAIEANASHPSLGFCWGAPGGMLAALFMFERTGGARWKALFLRIFEELWRSWDYDESLGCHLWTQDLYGVREQRLGGLHGFAATVSCMLRGRALLGADRLAELELRARQALRVTARREGRYANWPLAADETPSAEPAPLRVQHCIGAPGIVNCLASLPSEPETDALLLAAGELTWLAGPLVKLPGLCHGSPGSGYAFLKLFARTGDDEWLARARRFAMHAIGRAERGVAEHGQRKFSLWTGDLGLAAFLCDCLRASSEVPTLDVF
ncbi:MAG: lanthionine synthetase C family protein [Myxococcota bacterium]